MSALRYLHRVAHVQLQGGLLASLSLQRGRGKVDQTGRGPLGHSHLQQRLKLVYVANSLNFKGDSLNDNCKDATMVGFWEKSQKSDQMPYFGQNLVGFLSL